MDDNLRQQDEITHLLTQVVELQKKNRDLGLENEGFRSALEISHDCQKELTCELMEIKEKYNVLLAAFHDLQQEFKESSHLNIGHWNPTFIPVHESLAAELESTLASEGYGSDFSSFLSSHGNHSGRSGGGRDDSFMSGKFLETRCDSPDSLMSVETTSFSKDNRSRNTSASLTRPSVHEKSLPVTTATRSRLTDKLKNLKPFEGSGFLNRWRRLATPHLGVILEPTSGVQSKAIKDLNADFLQYVLELKKKPVKNPHPDIHETDTSMIPARLENNNNNYEAHPGKFFDATSFTYTFTTTSVSRVSESTTVTPSFSSVQLSTGHDTPITTSSSSSSASQSNPYSFQFCRGRDHQPFSSSSQEPATTSLTFSTLPSTSSVVSKETPQTKGHSSPKKSLENLLSPTGLGGLSLDFLSNVSGDGSKVPGVITRGVRMDVSPLKSPEKVSPVAGSTSCSMSLKTKTGKTAFIVSGKITKTKTLRKGGLV